MFSGIPFFGPGPAAKSRKENNRRRARQDRRQRQRRLLLELLEDRRLLATRIWDGGGGSNTSWSTAANWSDDTVPGAGDIAQFGGSSVGNSTIDAAYSLTGLDIQSGYTGTITQSSSTDLTIGASGYQQAAGTLTILGNLNLNGPASQTGGSLTVSGTTTIVAGTSGNVSLNQASNDFGTIAVTSANNVTLVDTNAIAPGGLDGLRQSRCHGGRGDYPDRRWIGRQRGGKLRHEEGRRGGHPTVRYEHLRRLHRQVAKRGRHDDCQREDHHPRRRRHVNRCHPVQWPNQLVYFRGYLHSQRQQCPRDQQRGHDRPVEPVWNHRRRRRGPWEH